MSTPRSAVAMACFGACALATGIARADLNETLDVSLHGSATVTRVEGAPELGPMPGLGLRLGETREGFRFGVGISVGAPVGIKSLPDLDGGSLLGAEAYVGWAPGDYRDIRPFLEVRAHGQRLQLGDDKWTSSGIGPRIGVLVPLSQYFFLDLGVGRDVIGPDKLSGSIGLGLPIPISHL